MMQKARPDPDFFDPDFLQKARPDPDFLFQRILPHYFFNVISVGGATVSGLENPNSKTQALPIFMKKIRSTKANIAIVMLGEVDTGFVIWYRSEKYNEPVSKMLDKALLNYQNLLLNLAGFGFNIICISTPLPTIIDGQKWGDVANARKEVKATQIERTNLTLEFNKNIHKFCKRHQITFISCDQDSLGSNGLVNKSLLNSSPDNHHYDEDSYARMLSKKLQNMIITLTNR